MTDRMIPRRAFLKGALAAGGTALAAASPVKAKTSGKRGESWAMMIDLTRCDGCPAKDTPACVAACRLENADKFPRPEKPIKDYFPQKKHEDWSGKKGLTDTLTPYNWTFVQKVTVEHDGRREEVNIPRHCMHCDNPPCVNLCPVGANTKSSQGPVLIDPDLCLGGAKCRSVCPWHIPQRQSGVGLYLNFDPLAGGGVLYKCDLCQDRLQKGQEPACVEACRQVRGDGQAMRFGPREEVFALAKKRAEEIGGHLYGLEENGGTSTVYVSRVPFESIDKALAAGKERFRLAAAKNPLEKDRFLMQALLLAPVAGLISGAAAAGKSFFRTVKKESTGEENPPTVKTESEGKKEDANELDTMGEDGGDPREVN